MKFILAPVAFAAAVTFCNLADTSRDERPPASNQSLPQRPAFDKNSVRMELSNLANDMTDAAARGDITFIASNTTDDFELTDVDGKVQNKNKALAGIKEERSVRSWAITDIELASADEQSATLRYILNITLKTGQSGRARTVDTYVKQDGRWLLKSEQQTIIK
jgi:Domain of unknown function (DUF4440)